MVTPTPQNTGMLRVTVRTNRGQSDLPPAVVPTLEQSGDIGPANPPGWVRSINFARFQNNIAWYRFVTAGTNDTRFVDVLAFNSNSAIDSQLGLYNCLGNRVAFDNNSGPGNLAQLSFGAPRAPRPPIGDGLPRSGQNGNLPEGEYYLAVGVTGRFGTTRWCARDVSPTGSADIDLLFDTNALSRRLTHGCCVADFDNGSGTGIPDGGVTIDDLLYYLAIYGNGAPSADVDDGSTIGTPDGGVTIDDLLYFLQRFADGC